MLMSNHMLVCAVVMRMRNHMYQKKLKKSPCSLDEKTSQLPGLQGRFHLLLYYAFIYPFLNFLHTEPDCFRNLFNWKPHLYK